MGGLKKIVVLLTLSLAGLSYWLYTPIPAGYSTSSANSLRVFLAVMKVSEVAVSSLASVLDITGPSAWPTVGCA